MFFQIRHARYFIINLSVCGIMGGQEGDKQGGLEADIRG